jgi:hypothetical protein
MSAIEHWKSNMMKIDCWMRRVRSPHDAHHLLQPSLPHTMANTAPLF